MATTHHDLDTTVAQQNGQPQTSHVPATLIPHAEHPNGPVVRARLRRTFTGIACMAGAGWLGAKASRSPLAKAFGLGLVAPGGGYAYTKSPARAAASAVGFGASLGAWWGAGPVLVPPAAWIGTAALASRRAAKGGPTWEKADIGVPLAMAAAGAAGLAVQQAHFRKRVKRGKELNERLSKVTFPAPSVASVNPPVTESTPEDLQWLRYALDLGLQPRDSWEGFSFIDQFREGAVRYQLNHLAYTLAMSTYTRTPAFTGYVAEAQRNAIEKMLDPRIWRYWAFENLWGYLKWDPDPIKKDNIMYSAYYGTMLGMYETVTGDHRYDAPGALTLRWGKNAYEYDFGSLTEVVRDQMLASPYCVYPCEPNWIYPYCNTYGINTALMYDRLHGGSTELLLAKVRKGLEENFVGPDGGWDSARSSLVGIKLPGAATGYDGIMSYWLNPGLPDIAQRTWWLARESLLKADGGWEVAPRFWDKVDPGDYSLGSSTFSNSVLLSSAREMGDHDAAAAIDRTLQELPTIGGDGARRFEGGSVYTSLTYALARVGRENGLRDLVRHGFPEHWTTGPVLSEAAYPQVLVAKAVSDGNDLQLVMRPGAGPTRTTLAVERLTPGKKYRVDGAGVDEITADRDGRAAFDVELGDRLEVSLSPEA
jgi:hypothetical protein